MIWREAYKTRVLEDAPMPHLAGTSLSGKEFASAGAFMLVGGFDVRSMLEREVWRRLVEESFGLAPWFVEGVFGHGWNEETLGRLKMATPPARHECTFAFVDPSWEWHRLCDPDRQSRALAAIIHGGRVHTLMIGPPTEDAWSHFQALLHELLGDVAAVS